MDKGEIYTYLFAHAKQCGTRFALYFAALIRAHRTYILFDERDRNQSKYQISYGKKFLRLKFITLQTNEKKRCLYIKRLHCSCVCLNPPLI